VLCLFRIVQERLQNICSAAREPLRAYGVHYQEGMWLLVTLPCHSLRDRRDREYLAQVVRVELLDDASMVSRAYDPMGVKL
jgi:hypothetical protein